MRNGSCCASLPIGPPAVVRPRHPNPARLAVLAALLALGALPAQAASNRLSRAEIDGFVAELGARHAFDRAELAAVLRDARVVPSILEAISRPAESKAWYQYRPIFLTEARIAAGVEFWAKYEADLRRAEREFGVPVPIIVAIIGVETSYGRNKGKYRVLDALATLGFRYPKRSAFFREELGQFLLLAAEQGLNPGSLAGSYAGAMGLPQFMPSSYRSYAVDFDQDAAINIWDNGVDALGSVAAYLNRHGWERGAPIAAPARVNGGRGAALANTDLEVRVPYSELSAAGVEAATPPSGNPRVNLVRLEREDGPEFWIGHGNFYVITRYNRSVLYAMAVHQLAEAIRERRVAP
jgi:membrane-bound lytic murein transglycosylase B